MESDRRNLKELKEQLEEERQKRPPIVVLSESRRDFRFDLGSAEPTYAFKDALETDIVPVLDSLSRECRCDGIEVIGHTDGVRVQSPRSTLDDSIAGAINRRAAAGLTAGSNVDLGMMRALAVMTLLQDARAKGKLKQISYWLPYSAGQLILPDRTLTGADTYDNELLRRRIEIRLLRAAATDQLEPSANSPSGQARR